MANYESNKTDPLWFLDNLEDEESKLSDDALSESGLTKRGSDEEQFSFEGFDNSESKSVEQIKNSNSIEILNGSDSLNEKGAKDKVINDEISLRSELENSLFDLAKQSIEKGENPEFRITITTNDGKQPYGSATNVDSFLFNNEDSSNQDDQTGNINITLSGEESGNSTGEKPAHVSALNSETENIITDNIKPKIYVIVKSNKNNNSMNNENKLQNINLNTDDEVCTEIGSTVINLNDFISPQSQRITGSENISSSVNFSDNKADDVKRKVELVITIKDERSKPLEKTTTTNTYTNEINTDFPSMDLLLGEPLETKLRRISERIRDLSSSASSLNNDPWQISKSDGRSGQGDWANDSWQTAKADGRSGEGDWSKDSWQTAKADGRSAQGNCSTETKDSFVRESDGARCYRTVTTTPRGRRVQTQCYKGDRRGTRSHSYDWSSGAGSYWNDLDDEFGRMFSRANRIMFF